MKLIRSKEAESEGKPGLVQWTDFAWHSEAALRETQLRHACEKAARSRAAGREIVLVTVVEKQAARFSLPLLVANLRSIGGLQEHLIVGCVSHAAYTLCQKVRSYSLKQCPQHPSA